MQNQASFYQHSPTKPALNLGYRGYLNSFRLCHYTDVIMSLMASQITSLTIVYPPVCSGTDQIKLQSSTSLAFVRGIHRGPVNCPHKRQVTRKMFPFDDVIRWYNLSTNINDGKLNKKRHGWVILPNRELWTRWIKHDLYSTMTEIHLQII